MQSHAIQLRKLNDIKYNDLIFSVLSLCQLEAFCRRDFLPLSLASRIRGVFSWPGFCADGTYSPNLNALGSGEYFLPPPISALSDRGSMFSRRRDFLPRSRRSHRRSIFTVGIFCRRDFTLDLGALRSGEYFHSWDFSIFRLSSQHALLTKQDIRLSS